MNTQADFRDYTSRFTFAFILAITLALAGCNTQPAVETNENTTPVPEIARTIIAAGDTHTCVLMNNGNVKCWGDNTYGQLGNGENTESSTPVSVIGLASSGVLAISAGGAHNCILTNGGGVKCWGYNSHGQLGNGTYSDSNTPVDVTGLGSGVIAISAGNASTCALTESGEMKCWGFNLSGQLGDGTTMDSNIPVGVTGLTSGVIAIAAGEDHTCAVTETDGVKCWGSNSSGQLGDGSNTSSKTPVNVAGLDSGVISISTGEAHTCILTNAGSVKCWGYNYHGQLGDGSNGDSNIPVDVTGLTSKIVAITVGSIHTCVLTDVGGIKCWGHNGSGQLGNGLNTNSNIPMEVIGTTSDVIAIATGEYHTCALMNTNGVMCWGYNWRGQLGNGTKKDSNTPVPVTDVSD